MIISGSSFFGTGGAGSYAPLRIAQPSAQPLQVPQIEGLSVEGFARKVLDVRGMVGKLRSASKVTRASLMSNLLISSSQKLGLDPLQTQTGLSSTEEINTLTTTYSGGPKTLQGTGTTSANVGGVYDGDQGTDTLTFTVKKNQGGLVGLNKIQFDVTDGSGAKVQTLLFKANQPAGTPVTLRNGLTVSLSSGLAVEGDFFTVAVADNVPQAVDPKAAFDGTPGPNFEPGLAVRQGQFRINGALIDVAASDSINSVLAKINQADIGVIAKFDKASETVQLLADSRGPGGSISLGGDNSGFFDATKLTGAKVVQGQESELDRVIGSVSALSGIASGDFVVNGQSLQVDTAVDTLQDVLDRITKDKQAGVVAYYDDSYDVIRIQPDQAGAAISLEDGTSGLFSALGIAPGTEGQAGRGANVFVDASKVRSSLQNLAESLQPLFSGVFSSRASTQSELAVRDLKSAVSEVFSDQFDANAAGDRFRSGLGIDFLFDDPNGDVVQIDPEKLSRTLKRNPQALIDLLFAQQGGQEAGLLRALDQAFDKIGERLVSYIDPSASGLLINLQA